MSENSKKRVLVTGASGYIATHCVQQLLDKGYTVRGTVRSLKNEEKVKPLRELKHASERLELVEADLLDEYDKWIGFVHFLLMYNLNFRIIGDCEFVLHLASPFPLVDDESTVQIAVNGTLNVLKACAKSPSVKKVVLTR
jgi:nucleoside-diphosphate-sugar epimerase